MSLTSFIKIPEVNEKFRSEFRLAPVKLEGEIKAKPVTTNYPLVGTAFDYLMRFYLERMNKNAITKHWVAENSVVILDVMCKAEKQNATTDMLEASKKMKLLMNEAKKTHDNYLGSGELDDNIIRTSIILAQMDAFYRSGMIYPQLGSVERGDITDLRNLISLVDERTFKSKSLCLLNPTFGYGSTLVGGADADLIIDETLIDIKTTKNLSFSQENYNQLIGYYILSKLGKLNESMKVPISKIGIYFSRHGILHTIQSSQIEMNPNFPKFVKWFEKKAKEVFTKTT